jgi:NHLM bacteriocin system ABC transporter peptidase/ATP-binding protein
VISSPATDRPTRAERAHTPTVLQMQVTECGAACLGMVLAHYGRWVSLDELRDRCGASRDGTTGSDMLMAGSYYGLEGKGYYRARRLLPELGTPLVLLWKGVHYVVLDGIDERHAWLNDPAVGPRRVTIEEFDRDYSRICLVLRPCGSFTPGGAKPSRYAGLYRRGRAVLSEVLAIVVVGLLLTLPGLAVAGISRLFVDQVLVAGEHARAWPLVLALAMTAVAQGALSFLQQRILLRVGTRLIVAETARFVDHALRLPEGYFVARSVADLSQRVQQNREVVVVLTGRLATALVGLVVVSVYAVAMFLVDPLMAIVAIALTLVNLVAMRQSLRRQRDGSRLLVQEQSALWQTTAYGALTMESIKAGGLEGDYYARWEGTAVRVAETRQHMAILGQRAGAVPATLRTLVSAVVLVLGAWRVIDGAMTLGSLIAFQALLGFFSAPIGELVGFASLIQHARNLVVRLDDVLDEPADPATRELAGVAAPARLRGALELRSVTFGFKPTRAPLISALDLSVEPGQRVAVVGASGSGKSTLVRVLAGLYEPWAGEVLLDGRRRLDIPREVLAASVGMVEQRIALFAGTVRDNLTLWDPDIPEADVVRAAQDAQIHDEIVARAGGYAAWVTDGGANWSGGQRQRFEIARALVRNPSVLLLDEATSALDAETEAGVENALRRRGCTTFVVAHRLSTVRDADLILVLDAGSVVERGRHDELLTREGPYAALIEA